MKSELLATALKLAPKHGWSTSALHAAARAHGFPAITGPGLLASDSRLGLLGHFYRDLDDRTRAHFVDALPAVKNTRDFYGNATRVLKKRLELHLEYAGDWEKALALMVDHKMESVALLSEIGDRLCRISGDRSYNMSWYGRRAAVSACCAATELYMIQDRSRGYSATFDFISRQMKNAAEVESDVDGFANRAVLYASALKGSFI